MKNNRVNYFANTKRVVVKIGSGVLTESKMLNVSVIRSVSKQVHTLVENGCEVIIVSSGAMASGEKKLGFNKRPDEIPRRQAIAAVGQPGLIIEYEKALAKYNKKVAQILLTSDDLNHRERYLNARNTIYTLLSWHVIPIINENDTVVIDEIKFGDNDNLAAMITLLMDADMLIILTDIEGLYTKNPKTSPDAELVPAVHSIGKDIEKMAGDIPGPLGTGGMLSKINAARKVTDAGIPMVIVKGEEPEILTMLFAGEEHGTFFVPKEKKLPSRKCWLAHTLKPKGALMLDDGAVNAIAKKGKSLLPIGIVRVEGNFGVGAPVEFVDKKNRRIGIGLVNYSAADIRLIKGLRTGQIESCLGFRPYDEVIHRDNLAITGVE